MLGVLCGAGYCYYLWQIANKILLSILGVLLKSYRPLCALVSYIINESNSTSLNIKVRVIVKVRIRDIYI